MPKVERLNRRCYKQGHRSQGAAEAHLRGLLKAQEFKRDAKSNMPMTVYFCIAKCCRQAPWHVGHDRYAKAV